MLLDGVLVLAHLDALWSRLIGDAPLQTSELDCNELEDARAATAAGQTLDQFYAERGSSYFEAPDREITGSALDSLPDPRKLKPIPLGFCKAGSATLGALSVGFIHCTTNGKYYISGGFTSALGIALSGQRLVVWGVEGATLDSVITGPSSGVEFSIGEGIAIGGTLVSNSSGVVAGVTGSLGFSVPGGLCFSETNELSSGKLPLVSSTYESVYKGVTELTFGEGGRAKVYDTLAQWPMNDSAGHGLYRYLEGTADSNLHDFTTKLPAPLEQAWNASAERRAIEDLVKAHGGEKAVTRTKGWGQLVPEMKALALQFYEREIKPYIAQ